MIRTKLSAYGGTRAQFVISAIKKALTLGTTEIVMGRERNLAGGLEYRSKRETEILIGETPCAHVTECVYPA